MNTKIDIKSAVFGLGAGVLVMLGIAAMPSSRDANGRYQVAGVGNHGLVLDTATGQVWRAYFSTTEGITDGDFFKAKIDAQK
jgi:hypothetical protein